MSGIGILGGTFDPIHDGHLALGQAAYELLKLDHVLFVPAARPPHKVADRVTDPEIRCRMVELAIAGNPAFEMSRMEIDRPGLSYTIDTLRAISAERRDGGAKPELTLILSILVHAAGPGSQGKTIALRTTANRAAAGLTPVGMGLAAATTSLASSFFIVGGLLLAALGAIALYLRSRPDLPRE